jgi:hypothetical protein
MDAAASSRGVESTDAEISGSADEASTALPLSTLPELNLCEMYAPEFLLTLTPEVYVSGDSFRALLDRLSLVAFLRMWFILIGAECDRK